MPRETLPARRRAIAAETLTVLDRGWYDAPSGRRVQLDGLAGATEGTRLHTPEELDGELDRVAALPAGDLATAIEVTPETTLAATARLAAAGGGVACLNFASAKNPGGGFRSGAQAQEESLARSSGLYASLRQVPSFYAHHRAQGDLLYSDHVIYSPAVPVFRDDSGAFLEAPYLVSFLTSPAPNAGAIALNQRDSLPLVPEVLARRAAKVLAVALRHGHRTLVLGAWGCGVFGNEPAVVAGAFNAHLGPGGLFAGRFERVTFAILDTRPDKPTLTPFVRALAAS
jgi:uncharacterized protein (TIGR02452 family)